MASQSSKSTKKNDLLRMLLDEDMEPKAVALALLTEITNGFSDKLEIGRGGFAVVYKGVLEDRVVAVKKLSNTYMYEKEFLREIECLMKVRHKNIVRFLGYCIENQGNVASNKGEFIIAEEQQRLLCFEYLPKGSLYDYIEDASGGLDWRTRYQIIKGMCEGLQYLHEINIVHLDLKPANVLLDEKMLPKITDFGLSRCFKAEQTRWDTTKLGGTLGYRAPESYSGTRSITYKFDLYSLGVMITEVITGEKGYQDVDHVLASWSNRCDGSQLEQIRVCSELGFECSDFNPGKRPKNMNHIVNRLAETESSQVAAAEGVSSEFLSVRPSALCFPFGFKKGEHIHCPLHLTNTTDEYMIFGFEQKNEHFLSIVPPRSTYTLAKGARGCGIVPPKSTYTIVLETMFGYDELEEMGIYDLVLYSRKFPYEQIRAYERMGGTGRYPGLEFYYSNSVMHEVTLKAFYTPPRGMLMSLSKQISPTIQTLYRYRHVDLHSTNRRHYLYSLDTVQDKQWIIVGEYHGQVTILDNRTQKQVNSMKVSRETVTCVKFIARKQWLVVGIKNGYIHVYNCETKMRKITGFRATDMYLRSLAVHPTQPYLLSSDHCGMKLWDWDKGFECIRNFKKEHSKEICQVTFNLKDTIASASEDHLVKIWTLGSPKSNYTLFGHSNKVNCLDFFTCDDHEYLVTGSDDQTSKIWDMRTKICIHTLEAFESPVTCVVYEPNIQILITGSHDGRIYYWNTLNSIRVVTGRTKSALIVDIDNGNINQEEYTYYYNETQLTEDTTYKVTPAGSSSQIEILDLHLLDIYFPYEDGTCSLQLTNKTDEHVAFCLREKSDKCGLPYGIVPPRSTYISYLSLEGHMTLEDRRDFEFILQSSILGDRYAFLFADQPECDDFFSQVKAMGNTVQEVSVKEGDIQSVKPVISPRVKITSKDTTGYCTLFSMDGHPTEPWIITGHYGGIISRWNYYSQSIATDHSNKRPEGFHRTFSYASIYPESTDYDLMKPVWAVKIIARKQWILAGSEDGVIHVYNYYVSGGNKVEKITTFRAPEDYRVTSLDVHPTQSYVVLTKLPHRLEMEVWGWDKGWECTQTYGDMLNPNSFASAPHHAIEQVPIPDCPKSDHTLPGHSDSVNCLYYFTRDDQQYLITGSDGCTAKIWDLQEKACIHTMAQEAIMSPVISVISLLPHRPYLLTGTEHGTVQVWSSTDFRLERTVNLGGGGPILGLSYLVAPWRVVVAQGNVVSIMEIDQEVEAAASEVNNENYVCPLG